MPPIIKGWLLNHKIKSAIAVAIIYIVAAVALTFTCEVKTDMDQVPGRVNSGRK